jgi:hypothetical protein
MDTLQQFLETQLRKDGISDTVALQQDKAPAHSMNAVQETSIIPCMKDGEAWLHQDCEQCAHLI